MEKKNTSLKQCHFCEDWFSSHQVEEITLARKPNTDHDQVFACAICLRLSRISVLAEKAAKALQSGAFNEIELPQGGLKVHLVRFTPSPLSAPVWQYPPSYCAT